MKPFLWFSIAILATACASPSKQAVVEAERAPAIFVDSPLSSAQLEELQAAVMGVSENNQIKPRISAKAFTQVSRLTIGPKGLPVGAVTKHLEEVFILKTDGTECFVVNEASGKTEALPTLQCRSLDS